jgi:tetratricopeptide (TPR) repeat protein
MSRAQSRNGFAAAAAIAMFAFACGALLAGCATPSAPAVDAGAPRLAPADMLAAIHAAGGRDDTELAIQPLRDPMVEDLREHAQRAAANGRAADAAAALDHALELVPGDPALLQERAEVAIALGDLATAQADAQRAWDLGGKVGPLCRRHAETLRQVRLAANDATGAAADAARRDACTVAAPARY